MWPWRCVPIGDIWADELLPLINDNPLLAEMHSLCVRAWIAEGHGTKDYNSGLDRTDVRYWAPECSCFYIAPFSLWLARAWKPDAPWQPVITDHHATTADPSRRLFFDLLYYNDADALDLQIIQNCSISFSPRMVV